MIIDGKALAADVEVETAERVKKLAEKGIVPGLATVLVGENPASQMYIRLKHSACTRVGIRSENVVLPENSSEEELIAKIQELNGRPDINGILLQLPLPKGLSPQKAMMSILPEKDVDGFHPVNMGALLLGAERLVPCTPRGIIYALERLGKKLEGAEAVIVGHSNVVGKPLAAMLLNRNATVQVCHVFTKDLAEHTRDAEILVVAAGVPALIKKEMVRPGAIVFDVGINRVGDKTVGDVDFDGRKGHCLGHNPCSGRRRTAHGGHAALPDGIGGREPDDLKMSLVIALAASREAVIGADRRAIAFLGPCPELEEELYSGQIKNDQELADRARELGASLQVSDGREKVWRRGDLLVGEVTEISAKLSRRRRIYLTPGASLQVDITSGEDSTSAGRGRRRRGEDQSLGRRGVHSLWQPFHTEAGLRRGGPGGGKGKRGSHQEHPGKSRR